MLGENVQELVECFLCGRSEACEVQLAWFAAEVGFRCCQAVSSVTFQDLGLRLYVEIVEIVIPCLPLGARFPPSKSPVRAGPRDGPGQRVAEWNQCIWKKPSFLSVSECLYHVPQFPIFLYDPIYNPWKLCDFSRMSWTLQDSLLSLR